MISRNKTRAIDCYTWLLSISSIKNGVIQSKEEIVECKQDILLVHTFLHFLNYYK